MIRPIPCLGLLTILTVGLTGTSTSPKHPLLSRTTGLAGAAVPAAPSQETEKSGHRAEQMRRSLAAGVTFGGFEPNTPLKDALLFLSQRFDLTLVLDTEAFKASGVADVDALLVKLPKVTNIKLSTVLDMLLGQVQAAYLVKSDHLLITTPQKLTTEVWGTLPGPGESAGKKRSTMPLVQAAVDRRPLDEALRGLAQAAGRSVILDRRRAGAQARTTVSGTFTNVPLDTAVRVLANEAGLQVVALDNALYVTTAEQANLLQKQQDKEGAPEANSGLNPWFDMVLCQQMRQPVNLELDAMPLEKALRELDQETDMKVVLDSRLTKEGQAAITLHLHDVALKTAVNLMAELAGLRAVLVGNVIFITSEASAARLQMDMLTPLLSLGMNGLTFTGGQAGGLGLGGAPNFGGGQVGALGAGGGLAGGNLGGMLGGFPGIGCIGLLGGGSLPTAGPARTIGNPPTVAGASVPPSEKKPTPEEKPTRKPDAHHAARPGTMLNRIVTLDAIAPNTPLKDALAHFQDKYQVTVLLDVEAFKAEGMAEPENQVVQLPRMAKVRVATILDQLVAQISGAYLVRPDHIEITTRKKASAEVWGASNEQAPEDRPGRPRPLLELAQAEFDDEPLDQALQELSDTAGISVILDRQRAGERARAAVTATFDNVPLDTAVRLLADQAGLQVAWLDDVLYVTTGENARLLQAEQEKRNQKGLDTSALTPGQRMPAAGM